MQSARYLTDNEGRDYYASKIQNIKNAGLLLAISEYSRQEAIDLLGISADNVVNISSAADDRFQPISTDPETASRLLKRYSIRRKFLMYTSSFDPRKNQANLVSAFALLPHELRGNFQLVIVGDGSEEAVRKLRQLAEKSGLDHDEVIFPGHIVDADLVALYNLCHLFVLPSLAEGFGLPALEAMSCGTAAIASDLTSLPEVLGWSEALFDPTDPRSIAKKIHQVLTDEGFLNALRSNGLVQAKKFSWKQTANNAFDAFESHHQRSGKNQTKRSGQQAALTPLEPVASQAMMGAEEVVDRILKLDQASALTNEDLMEIAVSIAANRDRVEALFAQ